MDDLLTSRFLSVVVAVARSERDHNATTGHVTPGYDVRFRNPVEGIVVVASRTAPRPLLIRSESGQDGTDCVAYEHGQ